MEKKSKKEEAGQPKKVSYEDLEKIAYQLRTDNNNLFMRLRDAEKIIEEFNEIGMLLAILDKSEHFPQAFVERCANRIVNNISAAMDIADSKKDEKEKGN